MKLGQHSQLRVYEESLKSQAEQGRRSGVELFGRLICELAGSEMDGALTKLDHIQCGDNVTIYDLARGPVVRQRIVECNGFLNDYGPQSPAYQKSLELADANSWKQ